MPGQKLNDFSKLRISDGKISYFIYQQDGTKQWMVCRDTPNNRLFVSWLQIHDSPTTGMSDPSNTGVTP